MISAESREPTTSTEPASTGAERLAVVAVIGLAGCALTILMTAPAEPLTTTRTVGAMAGIFLGFVALAGVVDTLRG